MNTDIFHEVYGIDEKGIIFNAHWNKKSSNWRHFIYLETQPWFYMLFKKYIFNNNYIETP